MQYQAFLRQVLHTEESRERGEKYPASLERTVSLYRRRGKKRGITKIDKLCLLVGKEEKKKGKGGGRKPNSTPIRQWEKEDRSM